MPTIEIQAIDTLFFRDGRPFEMGDDNWAEGIFPPPPSVIYGALRSAYASQNGITDPEEIEEKTKDLEINAIYYKVFGANYFPMPLDFVEVKGENDGVENLSIKERKYNVKLLKNKNIDFYSSLPFNSVFYYDDQVESVNDGIISINMLRWYLRNDLNKNYSVRRFKDLFGNEYKIGNALENNSRSVAEGKLYRVGMKRLTDISIIVKYSGLHLDLSKYNLLKLGAENKGATMKEIEELNIFENADKGKKFKVIFISPVIFKQGWLPAWIDKQKLEGEYKGIKFSITKAIVGKQIIVGGFDMKCKEPKPMLRAVPAGSVYFFETDREINLYELFESGMSDSFDISELYYSTNNKCSKNIDFNKIGFGKFLAIKL